MSKISNKHLIVWQKWLDPFGEDDIIETEDQNILRDDYDLETNMEDNVIKDSDKNHMQQLQRPMKAIATPMGIIPYTENTASGKIFNFWVGHTNFDITHKISDLIENVDGVEILDIFTRYRFRIAIGKAFVDSKVMKEINDTIYTHLG
jgi:hypothetical protein